MFMLRFVTTSRSENGVWILGARSENGCGKWHFLSEIRSEYWEPGSTPLPSISGVLPGGFRLWFVKVRSKVARKLNRCPTRNRGAGGERKKPERSVSLPSSSLPSLLSHRFLVWSLTLRNTNKIKPKNPPATQASDFEIVNPPPSLISSLARKIRICEMWKRSESLF